MPLYQYKCSECGQIEEFLRKFSEDKATEICPVCTSVMNKTISNVLFYKGDGYWEHNNYDNRSKHDLQEALDEHDGHRRVHDKIVNEERKAGLLIDE